MSATALPVTCPECTSLKWERLPEERRGPVVVYRFRCATCGAERTVTARLQ